MHSPGDPLNPAQLAGAQEALPMNNFVIPSHVMCTGGGSYSMNVPVLLFVPVQHANYNSHDVPFVPQKTDHKP